jgi:hypothetical protein
MREAGYPDVEGRTSGHLGDQLGQLVGAGRRSDGLYFAHINLDGPVTFGKLPRSIGVLESPDNPRPIGMASCRGWGLDGLAVWTLLIGGQAIPGHWVIIDREFRPA